MRAKAQSRAERYLTATRLVWIGLFAAGLVLWLFSFSWFGAARAWRALLISFLYFTPLSAGLVVWIAIIAASNGKWAAGHEHLAANGIILSFPSLAALLALWAASPEWAPWLGKPAVQGVWLNHTFVFSRDLLGLGLFWAFAWFYLRRRKQAAGKHTAPLFILIYGVVFTLIAFDLIMPLDPLWHSSLLGGYFFISGLYAAMAAIGLLAAWQPQTDPDFLHDVGKLTLAFSLLTVYMMFAQLLPIWYENLPDEASFVYDRLRETPAAQVSAGLLATIYLGPLVLLLTVQAKRNRYLLGPICGLILAALWVERWWLVMPTVAPGRGVGLAELSIAAAFLGLWGLQASCCSRLYPGLHKREAVRHE